MHNQLPPQAILKGYLPQMLLTKSLNIVAELNIADIVANGSMSVDEIAQKCEAESKVLFRLLRVLVDQGIFIFDEKGYVANSDVSEFLRSDVPGSQRNFIRMMGSDWMWTIFNHLDSSVKTGESSFSQAFPAADNLFQYFSSINPEGGKIFSQSMSSMSSTYDATVADSYDFSGFDTLLDIGGAEGNLLKNIKQKSPEINAVLFDLPHVIEQVKATDSGLAYEAGSFFEEIKTPADCILIKYVLHNWKDEQCLKILQNCRKSMREGGKLLIVEMLIDNDKRQVFEKSMDVVMLMLLQAAERTREEFSSLLNEAGFKLTRVIPTKSPLYILEAELV
ncbi:methyltransferase [Flammeovirgaceae bacterium SG7u.111]|nr:methyltransferase [Flammeovirgaceae bacterium SG7u.132]WPO34494.1 methyltransferase [Flammeovirgaceae bacterium SG7u.111]